VTASSGERAARRIGAGQIDDGNRLAVLRIGSADLLLDGDAGVVTDLSFQAGESVEERAFAAVRDYRPTHKPVAAKMD